MTGNHIALTPYFQGHLGLAQAIGRAKEPLRAFMMRGTTQSNLGILYHATHQALPKSPAAVPFLTLVTAFAISQLTSAFQIALAIYIPFLVIDLVVASILMSLGMMMLPPTVVSLPLKLLLFVAVNGWGMVVGSLLAMPH